ncbi:MAG: F0F1 ATP synthase subunit epsilon [Vicingaceae bacterium]
MHLEIVTPDKSLFKGEVDYVYCPGAHGSFGILNNHAPIIATLKKGEVKVKIAEENALRFDNEIGKLVHDNEVGAEVRFSIDGGVVEVLNNKVIVLAE